MPQEKYKPERVVTLLRQVEVLLGNGKTQAQACKEVGIHMQTYYRWRREYGGLKVERGESRGQISTLDKSDSACRSLRAKALA
ncbi:MAG: transposase [Terriglobia bacterium]